MKLGIRQDVLLAILEKGAMAAMSDEAQKDVTNAAPIIQSVKITVDKNFVAQSCTDKAAIQFSTEVKDENGIKVEEGGCVLVPAKQLIQWVALRGSEAVINMGYTELASPESVGEDTGSDSMVVKRVGYLRLSAKGGAKSASKWELECYDPQQTSNVNFDEKTDKCFDIVGKELKTAVKKVSFASATNDYEHVTDSVAIEVDSDSIYLCATDTKRCAIQKIDENAKNVKNGAKILASTTLLLKATDVLNEEKDTEVSCSEKDAKTNRIFMRQDGLTIRLSASPNEAIGKFPPASSLLKKKYTKIVEVEKDDFNRLMMSAAIVNPENALFTFDKEKKLLSVEAVSESGLKPTKDAVRVTDCSKDIKKIWGVSLVLSALKSMNSKVIQVSIPDEPKSMKLEGAEDKNFTFFTTHIADSKYQKYFEEQK